MLLFREIWDPGRQSLLIKPIFNSSLWRLDPQQNGQHISQQLSSNEDIQVSCGQVWYLALVLIVVDFDIILLFCHPLQGVNFIFRNRCALVAELV